MITVSSITTYAIKSTRGITHNFCNLAARGLENDRLYMLVDPNGRFITQRDKGCGIMATITAQPVYSGGLLVGAPNMGTLFVPEPGRNGPPAEPRSTQIWKDTLMTNDCGEEAAAWFSEFLKTECRLVHLPRHVVRKADPVYATAGTITSLADGFPVLVTNEASLDALGLEPRLMARFRPNIVLRGLKPFEEDAINVIQIGSTMMALVKPCSRCPMPAIDQITGLYDRASNPLTVLKEKRMGEGAELKGMFFGQNAVPMMTGEIGVGMEVQVLSRKKPHEAVANLPLRYRA